MHPCLCQLSSYRNPAYLDLHAGVQSASHRLSAKPVTTSNIAAEQLDVYAASLPTALLRGLLERTTSGSTATSRQGTASRGHTPPQTHPSLRQAFLGALKTHLVGFNIYRLCQHHLPCRCHDNNTLKQYALPSCLGMCDAN